MEHPTTEGEAFKVIDEALSALDAEAQARIIVWANLKFMAGKPIGTAPSTAIPSSSILSPAGKKPPANAGKLSKPKKLTPKKSKIILKIDKDIVLFPEDAKTSAEFASEKAPSNAQQKGVVAIYYICNVLGRGNVTIGQVAAFFKAVRWRMPANLPNTLQQAGTKGWLDTSNSEDIKITSSGENLVEHQLPRKQTN